MSYVDYKKVGQRLAARRHQLGLKQWQVIEMAGLSDKYLSNIERATSKISIDVLLRLCDALDTTPDCILLGTTEKSEDVSAALESRLRRMDAKQQKLALDIMDCILDNKIN